MAIKTVLFDMFNTLADPHTELEDKEAEAIGMSTSEWISYVWRPEVTKDRGTGRLKTEDEIMDRICSVLPFTLTDEQRQTVMEAHRDRMYRCLTEIPADVLETIVKLKNMGLKVGLVSNADVIDIMGWPDSPLCPYFDDVIFSCNVGIEKPDTGIYEIALKNLGADPKETAFVGDGGSQEHMGAKALGMTTIWTEHLRLWDQETREHIQKYADFHVTDFTEIPRIISDSIDISVYIYEQTGTRIVL